jgi:hypothetical protein
LGVLPIIGALIAVGEAATHWLPFHWAGIALSAFSWGLWIVGYLKIRNAPVGVLYRCQSCAFLGDEPAVEAHKCLAGR